MVLGARGSCNGTVLSYAFLPRRHGRWILVIGVWGKRHQLQDTRALVIVFIPPLVLYEMTKKKMEKFDLFSG